MSTFVMEATQIRAPSGTTGLFKFFRDSLDDVCETWHENGILESGNAKYRQRLPVKPKIREDKLDLLGFAEGPEAQDRLW